MKVMLPRPDNLPGSPDLARLITRQIKTADNVRNLGRMPGLEADPGLPEEFRKLLGKLDRAEEEESPATGDKRKP